MPIDIKMPALSPTMEQGTLAKWLVKEGDTVSAGDILAEIETDKATMEFEAVDEGTILSIAIPEGSEDVKVGTVIATLGEEGEEAAAPAPKAKEKPAPKETKAEAQSEPAPAPTPAPASKAAAAPAQKGDRIVASPLARRIAEQKGVDLAAVKGSGPNGRIVKADVEATRPGAPAAEAQAVSRPLTEAVPDFGIPFEDVKLSSMRKVALLQKS